MVGFGYGRTSSVRLDPHAKLPDPKMPTAEEMQAQRSLEVPNQLGPELGVSRPDTVGMSQMFPNLVPCPDGTMIDFKTGRVVVDPSRGHQAGEWAPTKIITPPQVMQSSVPGSWNQPLSPQLSQSLAGSSSLDAKASEQYWREQEAEEKAKQPKMSDEQKKLLADLEDGKLMRLSKLELVDESLKKQSKSI